MERLFTSYSEARRRIGELLKAGLVREQVSEAVTNQRLLRLSPKGKIAAQDLSAHLLPQRAIIAPHRFSHDAKLIHLRLTMEEKYDGHWIPEILLRREYKDPPDGSILFSSGKRINFELENSLKGKDRFLRKAHRADPSAIVTVYVATLPCIEATLKRNLSAENIFQSILGLTSYEALREGKGEMWCPPDQELSIFNKRAY